MSIRSKISLLFTGLVTLIMLGLCFVIYVVNAREQDNRFHKRLLNRAQAMAEILKSGSDSSYGVLRMMDDASAASFHHKSSVVLDTAGNLLYSFGEQPADALTLTAEVMNTAALNGHTYFSVNEREATAVRVAAPRQTYIVAVAGEDVDGNNYLARLRELLGWCFAIAIVVTLFTGYFFANIILTPLKRMISEVKLVSSNNLSQRIHTGSGEDEMQLLGKTFNELLDKIQESFIIQRRFISNASHELSTPLTSAINQLEVCMQKERNREEYREVIGGVYEDVKELHLLTRTLLDIAKSGTGGSLELEEVRIDEVLVKLASDIRKRNKGYTVQLFYETVPENELQLTVFGNANLLYIALKNIVENGCKYSDTGTATVGMAFTEKEVKVRVHSKGDIISASELDDIFHPFYRSENVGHKKGSGLGLTLAKRILSLHYANIEVKSNAEEGTSFMVTIPVLSHGGNLQGGKGDVKMDPV